VPYINQAGGGSAAIGGVTVTGPAVSGDVPVSSSVSAASWAFPPGHEFGYDQITAAVNIASTTEATGTAIISCAAHTFDGAPVIFSFFSPQVATGTAISSVVISLFEGASQIGEICNIRNPAAQQDFWPVYSELRFTPTAAAHTYTVTAFSTNLTGTPSVGAGAGGTGVNVAAFCRFTKV
jgi:hypothetical protein